MTTIPNVTAAVSDDSVRITTDGDKSFCGEIPSRDRVQRDKEAACNFLQKNISKKIWMYRDYLYLCSPKTKATSCAGCEKPQCCH